MLSRNFRLQKVGDLQWIEKQYNFKGIAFSIDELIILNVNRDQKNIDDFCNIVTKLVKDVFVPISVGGGITSFEYAKLLFMSGADKIVINSAVIEDPGLIKILVKEYGSQAIIASVDFQAKNKEINVYANNGTKKIGYTFSDYLKYIHDLGFGEIYLNSMGRDGTGQGYDLDILEPYFEQIKIPLIMAGGAGNVKHFIEATTNYYIDAVATANLFNFIGNALPNARKEMIGKGIALAKFMPIG